MSWFSRLRNLVRSDDISRDIDREMSFHLAERTDDLVAAGMTRASAAHEARRRFGNYALQAERTRERDVLAWLATFVDDLRYAARTLRAAPVFALVAILSLALGIGANTAIFTIIDAVMLRALPVNHPEQLLAVIRDDGSSEFTNPLWEQLRDRQDVFSGIFAYGTRQVDLANGGEARRAGAVVVSGDFFSTLGVRPAAGRLLARGDDVRGCPQAAVISSGFWESEYGNAERAIGASITLNGQPFQIVGVTDPAFTGVVVGRHDQIYLPLCALPKLDASPDELEEPSTWFLHVIGRPKPGITSRQIDAHLRTIAPAMVEATVPPDWAPQRAKRYLGMSFQTIPAANGFSDVRTTYRKALLVVMAIVALVLLIACANVANLLLARATVRQREIAVRLAIGAGRARLFRQLLTESVFLSSIGAALGVVIASWGSRALVASIARNNPTMRLDLPLDMRVLAFTAGAALLTGILFGLAPAWRAGRVDPQAAMKANGHGIAEGQSRFSIGKALVVAQVALSLVLITAAGLLLGSWRNLVTLDPGFRRDRVLLVDADLSPTAMPPEQRRGAYGEMIARLRAIPGVRGVGISQITPIGTSAWNGSIVVDGYTPTSKRDAVTWANSVGASYFDALHIPLLAGRNFDNADTPEAPTRAIVSLAMAKKFFGSGDVLGKQFRTEAGKHLSDPIEIVGVVGDTKYRSLRDSIQPIIYFASSQEKTPSPGASFVISANVDPMSLAPQVKAQITSVHPRISIDIRTLEQQVNASLTVMRTIATLSGFFGALALALATIGLYGIMAYSVARRRNEIGVRIALGAAQARVVRMVLGEVGRIVVVGVAAGVALSFFAAKLIAAFLYGTTPNDPATLGEAGALLLAVGLFAAAFPAVRAARLDPVAALREE